MNTWISLHLKNADLFFLVGYCALVLVVWTVWTKITLISLVGILFKQPVSPATVSAVDYTDNTWTEPF